MNPKTIGIQVYTGKIVGALRKADGAPVDALQLDSALSMDLPAEGDCLLVTWKNQAESFVFGYELDRHETINGKSWVVLKEDHGMRFQDGLAKEIFKPNREQCYGAFALVPSATTMPGTPHGVTPAVIAQQHFIATLPAVSLTDLIPGITYKLYSGYDRATLIANQDLNKLKSQRKGVCPVFSPVGTRSPYAAQYNGYIQIPETGMVTFFAQAHHGAILYIDDVKIIDAFGRSDPLTWSAQVPLEKGFHKIRCDFSVWRFDGKLNIEIEGVGLRRQSIPAKMLFSTR